jgi:hypothetical protein
VDTFFPKRHGSIPAFERLSDDMPDKRENLENYFSYLPQCISRKRIAGMPSKNEKAYFINGDLENLVGKYQSWLKVDSYLVFELIERHLNTAPDGYSVLMDKKNLFFRRCRKRGNKEYVDNLKRRLDDYNSLLPDVQFFNPNDRSRVQHTKMFFAVLTVDPKRFKSRHEAWSIMDKDVNKFISNLKRFFGSRIQYCRSWECFYEDAIGYPHVNLVIFLEDTHVDCFLGTKKLRNGKKIPCWRLYKKSEIAKYWKHGHIDVQAVSKMRKNIEDGYCDDLGLNSSRNNSVISFDYLTKYITKNMREDNIPFKILLLNAILWVLRKRSFSLSKKFLEIKPTEKSDLSIVMSNSNNFLGAEEKIVFEYVFLGVFPACFIECILLNKGRPPPKCPYYNFRVETSSCTYSEFY